CGRYAHRRRRVLFLLGSWFSPGRILRVVLCVLRCDGGHAGFNSMAGFLLQPEVSCSGFQISQGIPSGTVGLLCNSMERDASAKDNINVYSVRVDASASA